MYIFSHPLFAPIGRMFAILAAIVVFVAFMIWIGNVQDHANDPQKLSVDVNASDWLEGGADASVTLVEYSDFQCPACGIYYSMVKSLHESFGDQIKIVYRNFPLASLHDNAQLAAQAAEASGLQGKFFEMHDILFEEQANWSELSDPTETFVSYAASIGLDIEKFKSDLTSDAVKRAVSEDIQSGESSNVSGTPTFFLNGFEIDNPQGLGPFTDAINAALLSTVTVDTAASSATN